MADINGETIEAFERAIAAKKIAKYRLRLFISGSTPRSTQAVKNIRSLCERYLTDRYDLEVIDLYQQPDMAKEAQVIAAPTLIRDEPLPPRRVIGDMADEGKVLLHLEVEI